MYHAQEALQSAAMTEFKKVAYEALMDLDRRGYHTSSHSKHKTTIDRNTGRIGLGSQPRNSKAPTRRIRLAGDEQWHPSQFTYYTPRVKTANEALKFNIVDRVNRLKF
jgi:hypothetical protein